MGSPSLAGTDRQAGLSMMWPLFRRYVMKMKEAVGLAKKHIAELFFDEQVTNIGLEEIEVDASNNWTIIIGFSRPWDKSGPLAVLGQDVTTKRSYKIVRIDDQSGEILSVKDRDIRP
jgi:hypothetical protein